MKIYSIIALLTGILFVAHCGTPPSRLQWVIQARNPSQPSQYQSRQLSEQLPHLRIHRESEDFYCVYIYHPKDRAVTSKTNPSRKRAMRQLNEINYHILTTYSLSKENVLLILKEGEKRGHIQYIIDNKESFLVIPKPTARKNLNPKGKSYLAKRIFMEFAGHISRSAHELGFKNQVCTHLGLVESGKSASVMTFRN